jgi:hypothetical protein
MTKLVISVRHDIIKRNANASVIELGNQRFRTDKKLRSKTYDMLGIPPAFPTTVKEFYESIGFKKYIAIDVNTDKDAIALDLNLDLRKDYNYKEQYDLVTNNGTGEHIFNQYTVFKNVHDLCKEGGVMIHNLPYTGYIDHGFYSFQPNLFIALAYANNYSIQEISVGTSDGDFIKVINHNYVHSKENKELMNIWRDNLDKNLLIAVILKKNKNSEFKMPIQGRYENDIASAEIKNRYS